jgi:TonB family protein
MRYVSVCAVLFVLACAHATPGATPAAGPVVDTARAVLDTARGDERYVVVAAAVDSGPTFINCPPPDYPDTLRRARIQGRVILELVIDTLGRPEPGSVRALTSPHDSLSRAAVNAMLACTFTAARFRGRAVRVLVNIPIDFNITSP